VRAILSNADQIVADAILPEIGPSYNPYIEFELVVTGDSGFRDRDIARIRIYERSVTPPSPDEDNGNSGSASAGGGSSFSAPWLLVLALLGLATARRRKTGSG
jgi:MYXO-CTERM domain-containing protein